jgi:beta-lactamase regulating signal transducer with metallopeptidase domain
MIDGIVHFGVSNVLLSLLVAIVAYAVHRAGRWPMIAHLLWVLVLVKLITPPIIQIPIWDVTVVQSSGVLGLDMRDETVGANERPTDSAGRRSQAAADAVSVGTASPARFWSWSNCMLLAWGVGSAVVFAWSAGRIVRFHRLLRTAAIGAPEHVQHSAARLARRIGLQSVPMMLTTTAHLSPMVWWMGGRPRVVLPRDLLHRVDAQQLDWIVAHELAHVKRRDHLVRWLEWLTCVGFWWNPVAWWARRNLRINEEICCDALVLSSFRSEPRSYARALMTVVEFLGTAVMRPPAVVSAMSSGRFLERRFRMLVAHVPLRRTPSWLRMTLVVGALGLFSLSMTTIDAAHHVAQDTAVITPAAERAAGASWAEGEVWIQRVTNVLADQGIAREYLPDVMIVVRKIVAGMRDQGDAFVLNPLDEAHLVIDLGLTAAQVDDVLGISRRVANVLDKRERDGEQAAGGRDGERVLERRVANALRGAGIPDEKIREVMRVMRTIVAEIHDEGNADDPDPHVQASLADDLGLTAAQIEFVMGLAERLAVHLANQEADRHRPSVGDSMPHRSLD